MSAGRPLPIVMLETMIELLQVIRLLWDKKRFFTFGLKPNHFKEMKRAKVYKEKFLIIDLLGFQSNLTIN